MLVVNAANAAKDYAWISEQVEACGRCGSRRLEQPLRADRDPGAGGARSPAAADRRRPRRHSLLLVRLRRSGQRPRDDLAHRLHRRGRLRDLRPAEHGRPRLAGAPRIGPVGATSSRAASARATRCASKPRCACTATTSTSRRRCSRPAWVGRSAGRRATSSGANACSSRRRRGITRKLVGFEMIDRGIARQGYQSSRAAETKSAWSRAARRRRS